MCYIFVILWLVLVSSSLVLRVLAGDWYMYENESEFLRHMTCYTHPSCSTASNLHELTGDVKTLSMWVDTNKNIVTDLNVFVFAVFCIKAQPNARNISMQHLATLLDRVVRCCEGAGQTRTTSCNIQKCCNKNLTIFKLDPTPSNILQYLGTCCYRVAKRV